MDFQARLAQLPSIAHLAGLDVLDKGTVIHHIPAVQGKLGSLRVYYALAQQNSQKLDRTSAQLGLEIFAEHTQDAKLNPGKHPNIDLLLRVIEEDLNYQLSPIFA